MARITIEDCLEHVNNRFELVLLASKRAHQINEGQFAVLQRERGIHQYKEKPTVLALREIASDILPNMEGESDQSLWTKGFLEPLKAENIQTNLQQSFSSIEDSFSSSDDEKASPSTDQDSKQEEN